MNENNHYDVSKLTGAFQPSGAGLAAQLSVAGEAASPAVQFSEGATTSASR